MPIYFEDATNLNSKNQPPKLNANYVDLLHFTAVKSAAVIINDRLEDEDEKLKTLIAANFGRLKNDPIKQAKLIVEYEKLNGIKRGRPEKSGHNVRISQEDIAKEFGVDVRTIRRIKELSALLPEFQDIISSGCITATTGYKILAKLSEEDQQKLLEELPVSQKLTQKQVQEYVDRIQELENINLQGHHQRPPILFR